MEILLSIVNHPFSFFILLLGFVLYLITSNLRRKLSKGFKCHYCKKGKMQEAKLEPRMMNFADTRSSFGLGGRSHNKSSVIMKVTYQCSNCEEFISREENR